MRQNVCPAGPCWGGIPAKVDVSKWLCQGHTNGITLVNHLPFETVQMLAYTLVTAWLDCSYVNSVRVVELLRHAMTQDEVEALQAVAYQERRDARD